MRVNSLIASGIAFGVTASAATSGFASSCTNIRLQDNWVVADCLDSTSGSTRTSSAIHLAYRISNKEGTLTWAPTGDQRNRLGFYTASCTGCAVSGATLTCSCKPSAGAAKTSTINLEEHIGAYVGQLRYVFDQFPVAPRPSSFKVPTGSLAFSIGLSDVAQCAHSAGVTVGTPGPVDCFSLTLTSAGPPWESANILKNQGYTLSWYDNTQCSGAPVGSTTDGSGCKNFAKAALGFKTTPRFNADW